MLQITIPAAELWDETKQEFVNTEEQTIELEHSLVSLAKWEAKWHKSFLFTKNNTDEEIMDYIKCMTLTENVKPETYGCLTPANIKEITDYINAPMTATTFAKDNGGKKSREIVTAEIIYYWMISAGVPPEYRYWHLNSLIALLRVCSIKNAPSKKMSKRDIMSQNAALNAARRKQLNTKG